MNLGDLVLYGEPEEDLRAMTEHFVEVCRRRGLKVNAGKNNAIVLGGEEELECKVCVDGNVLSMSWNSDIWDAFWTSKE